MFTSSNPPGNSTGQHICAKPQKLTQCHVGEELDETVDFTDFINDTRNDMQRPELSLDSTDLETFDISGHSSEPQTVSPQELLLDSVSAPPSATLTNVSTPGYSPWESPLFTNSADTSPSYGLDEIGETFSFSLFPDSGSLGANDVFSSPAMEDLKSNNAVAPAMSRNPSSSSQSPFLGRSPSQGRHSSIAGVNARKRTKPLPPIALGDPTDLVSVKRARNTAAARKSRQKKTQLLEDLEEQVGELKSMNAHLQTENAHFKSEAARWRTIARGNGD